MSEVLAISPMAKHEQERIQKEEMSAAYADFLRTDPEVRAAMLELAKQLIKEMRDWDFAYHSSFKEVTAEILRSDELRPYVIEAAKKILVGEDQNASYRIYDALGEHLAAKITMKIDG